MRSEWGRLSLPHSDVVARLNRDERRSPCRLLRVLLIPPAAGPSSLAPPPTPRRSSPRVWAVLEPLSDAALSALPASSPHRRRYLELKTDQSTY